ncbi:type II toxin-antitoxin system VapC family toxin [Fulvimarina sp. 2208YS6-2-32]|uniref:Ribonuclease VapC n=1 Tax=Fulvimarina uroteuthidis TaxID=3098149 RepID=A0ABU5I9K8_9HYPH|nr:type II toxin-antitoxin system VapC family toxin [Fulvimarina sp. 2208YS6-2-32]MDY8110946.1 type II toxin-antitoxin system VapC family toxin [Fulvimarina sp. 2208YS6-2-32]
MPSCVVDTSAVFVDLNEETGAAEARRWLRDAAISAINLQEVVSKSVDKGVPAEAVPRLVEALRLDVRALDAELAMEAGLMRSATVHLGLSHGDRACLALARQLDVPAVTADRAWKDVEAELGVKVVLVR